MNNKKSYHLGKLEGLFRSSIPGTQDKGQINASLYKRREGFSILDTNNLDRGLFACCQLQQIKLSLADSLVSPSSGTIMPGQSHSTVPHHKICILPLLVYLNLPTQFIDYWDNLGVHMNKAWVWTNKTSRTEPTLVFKSEQRKRSSRRSLKRWGNPAAARGHGSPGKEFFNMQERTNSVSRCREVEKDNDLKVAIGFSNKVAIYNLAESSFSRTIRAEASLQWVEYRMGSKELSNRYRCLFKENAVAEKCHGTSKELNIQDGRLKHV